MYEKTNIDPRTGAEARGDRGAENSETLRQGVHEETCEEDVEEETCAECGGTGEVSVEEEVYHHEPHRGLVGVRKCVCTFSNNIDDNE